MCGICGFYGHGDAHLLESMNDLMLHRGPDGGGTWFDPENSIGLAMRRLSIIDIEGGQQPIFNEDKSMLIVFNGEIYNARALRTLLVSKGHQFRTQADTEVILHGYEEWGEAVVHRLQGMFAFTIMDKTEHQLFCARDRIGIKPFYYAQSGNSIGFASEIKPLLLWQDSSPICDMESLVSLLLVGFLPTHKTFYQNILQLKPGHTLAVTPKGVTTACYWTLPIEPAKATANFDELAQHVQERLFETIKNHMVSDVPVGLTLSGGLDSSAVLMGMSQSNQDSGVSQHAYTVGYGAANDETPYARMAARGKSFRLHERTLNPKEVLQSLPKALWHMEEPFANPVALTTFHLARFVSENLKVILIGEGADELFAGYPHQAVGLWPFNLLPGFMVSRLYRMAFLQPGIANIKRLLKNIPKACQLVDAVLHDQFLDLFKPEDNRLRSVLRFDIEQELPSNQLMRVDKMMMAHSVEARVPFLDHQFVEMAWGIPESFKRRKRVEKTILRHAMRNELPMEIVNRPKAGKRGTQAIFPLLRSAGVGSNLQRLWEKSSFADSLSLNKKSLLSVLARSRRLPVVGSGQSDKLAFTLLGLTVWHELFIANEVPSLRTVPALNELTI